MPKRASRVNQTLTNYAQGLGQDRRSALADFIAPPVTTGVASGQFKRFSDKNAFQVCETDRAVGGPARRIEFDADDPTFNCRPQALEIGIDDHERELAGEVDPLGLEQAKVDTVVTNAALSHEFKVFGLIAAGVSAVGAKGVWSDPDVDPIAELDEQIEAIAVATGMMPNRMVFGIGAWRVFRNHPKVIARQPGAAQIGISTDQGAKMLLNPGIEIRVGVLSRDTKKFGAAKNAVNIVGAEVYLFYGSQSPTTYDPSFAKTFTSDPARCRLRSWTPGVRPRGVHRTSPLAPASPFRPLPCPRPQPQTYCRRP